MFISPSGRFFEDGVCMICRKAGCTSHKCSEEFLAYEKDMEDATVLPMPEEDLL